MTADLARHVPAFIAVLLEDSQLPFVKMWLLAFAFTQLVEVPIYVRLFRCSIPAAFGASAITHPIVWFGFFNPLLYGTPYWPRVIAAELFAWLVEAAYFAFVWKRPRALLGAFVANAASVSAGFLSRWLFGMP